MNIMNEQTMKFTYYKVSDRKLAREAIQQRKGRMLESTQDDKYDHAFDTIDVFFEKFDVDQIDYYTVREDGSRQYHGTITQEQFLHNPTRWTLLRELGYYGNQEVAEGVSWLHNFGKNKPLTPEQDEQARRLIG